MKQRCIYGLYIAASCVLVAMHNMPAEFALPTSLYTSHQNNYSSAKVRMPKPRPFATTEGDTNNNDTSTKQSSSKPSTRNQHTAPAATISENTRPRPLKPTESEPSPRTVPKPEPTVQHSHQNNTRQFSTGLDCNKPWLTGLMDGRLGNQICYYAHMLILHLQYGIQVGIRKHDYQRLSSAFPHMSIEQLPKECSKARNLSSLYLRRLETQLSSGIPLSKSMILVGYPCNLTKLWSYRSVFHKEFTFSERIQTLAKRRLHDALNVWRNKTTKNEEKKGRAPNGPTAKETSAPVLVVGVHVRRTDYLLYFPRKTGGGSLPGVSFYEEAFSYFRKKYGRVAFVVTSDDRKWCMSRLVKQNPDVVMAPKGTPAEDMALLSMTNHIIFSVGTFGMWASLLNHGTIVYPQFLDKRKSYFMSVQLEHINSSDFVKIPYN